jgi:hypothetical protein
MTATSSQTIDDAFKHFDKQVTRKEQSEQDLSQRQRDAQAAWQHFRDKILQAQLHEFSQNVISREGRMQFIGDMKTTGVEVFEMSRQSLAQGAILQFTFSLQNSTFVGEVIIGGRRTRHEVISPENGTREWIARFVGFFLEDYFKAVS